MRRTPEEESSLGPSARSPGMRGHPQVGSMTGSFPQAAQLLKENVMQCLGYAPAFPKP